MNGGGKLYTDRNLLIIFMVTATSMMGTSALTPAFPQIMAALNIDSEQAGLLIAAYSFPGIFFTPMFGLLADRIGRKKVLVPSLIIYAVAGAGCAFTDSFELIVVLRVIQGAGGGCLGALNNTVIGELFEGRKRMEAMGYNSSVQSATMLGYPLLGGAVALFGWHYPFLLPLFGLVAAYFVAFHLKNPETKRRMSLGEYVGSAVAGIANRRMLSLFATNLITTAVSFGVLIVYIAVLMEERFGANPLEIGVIVAFSPVISTIMSTQAGRIRDLLTFRQMIVSGLILSGVGVWLNVSMPTLLLLLVPALLRGIAQGVLNPSVNTLVAEFAPVETRAGVMALNSMMFRLGQTFGPLIFAGVAAIGGMDLVFHVGGVVLAVTGIVVGIALGDIDKVIAERRGEGERLPPGKPAE
jgi:MFS family permease